MLSGPATEPAGNERMALMTSLSVTDTALNVNGSGTTERFTEAGGVSLAERVQCDIVGKCRLFVGIDDADRCSNVAIFKFQPDRHGQFQSIRSKREPAGLWIATVGVASIVLFFITYAVRVVLTTRSRRGK